MKQILSVMLSLVVMFFAAPVQAQNRNLVLQHEAAGLYLTHTVAPHENFYSIGRLYNISPKVIAPFNGLDLNGGLSIGQVIKIPLKPQNYTTSKQKVPGVVMVPVYKMDDGKEVFAGYLKVVKGQSALANSPAPAVAEAPPAAAPAPEGTGSGEVKAATAAAATTDILSSNNSAAPAGSTAAAKKKAPAKVKTPAAPAAAAVVPAVNSDSPVAQPVATTTVVPASNVHYAGEGAFHTDYMTQTDNGRKIRSSSGLAGVFKSTSGWDNGKFYALMNHVERGTVVKVTNLSNNKVVFVKVLSDIADIKQNSGMVIVLSDAAVSQLGVGTDRFTAEVTYAR